MGYTYVLLGLHPCRCLPIEVGTYVHVLHEYLLLTDAGEKLEARRRVVDNSRSS